VLAHYVALNCVSLWHYKSFYILGAAMLTMFCWFFRYTKYRITSLEKNYIPKMIVPEDIGIPLDLLDMSVYK
jgi:hypothetical protein